MHLNHALTWTNGRGIKNDVFGDQDSTWLELSLVRVTRRSRVYSVHLSFWTRTGKYQTLGLVGSIYVGPDSVSVLVGSNTSPLYGVIPEYLSARTDASLLAHARRVRDNPRTQLLEPLLDRLREVMPECEPLIEWYLEAV